jgi:hypothetical protein
MVHFGLVVLPGYATSGAVAQNIEVCDEHDAFPMAGINDKRVTSGVPNYSPWHFVWALIQYCGYTVQFLPQEFGL